MNRVTKKTCNRSFISKKGWTWPSPSEIDAILAEIPERHRLMYLFQYHHILRESEVTRVRCRHFDFSNKTVLIERRLSGDARQDWRHRLPVNADLIDRVQELCLGKKPDDLLFPSEEGKEYTIMRYRHILRTAATAAGYTDNVNIACTAIKHFWLQQALVHSVRGRFSSSLRQHID